MSQKNIMSFFTKSPSQPLTPEQQARAEKNRQEALAKLAAAKQKSSQQQASPSSAPLSTPPAASSSSSFASPASVVPIASFNSPSSAAISSPPASAGSSSSSVKRKSRIIEDSDEEEDQSTPKPTPEVVSKKPRLPVNESPLPPPQIQSKAPAPVPVSPSYSSNVVSPVSSSNSSASKILASKTSPPAAPVTPSSASASTSRTPAPLFTSPVPSSSSKSTPAKSTPSKSPFASPSAASSSSQADGDESDEPVDLYKRYPFLKDPQDFQGRTEEDPDYDCRQLLIPKQDLAKMKPMEKQYWTIKSHNFDSILLFKKGKFWEFYNEDAEIASKVLEIKMTSSHRSGDVLCGVPESKLEEYAKRLLLAGYKLGRVDEIDSEKKSSKDITHRELKAKFTLATISDPEMLRDADKYEGINNDQIYLLAICEEKREAHNSDSFEDQNSKCRFGVCLVDSLRSEVILGQFEDDARRMKLETLLIEMKPTEILFAKHNLSPETNSIFKNTAARNARRTPVLPDREFWSYETTIANIERGDYFGSEWPRALTEEVEDRHELSVSALGATIHYLLSEIKTGQQILSLKNFHRWEASVTGSSSSASSASASAADSFRGPKCMILDGQTLANLDILENNNGRKDGTLWALLNKTVTSFGSRKLRNWMCRPLIHIEEIEERLNAIYDLSNEGAAAPISELIASKFKGLGDVERSISQIHAIGSQLGSNSGDIVMHNRAEVTRKRWKLMADTYTALETIDSVFQQLSALHTHSLETPRAEQLTSSLLQRLASPGADYPETVFERLGDLSTLFDMRSARQGTEEMTPPAGAFPEWDQFQDKIANMDAEVEKVVAAAQKVFGQNVKVITKKQVQYLEVTKAVWDKAKGHQYKMEDSTTQKVTFSNRESSQVLNMKSEVEDTKLDLLLKYVSHVFRTFDSNYSIWRQVVECAAELDALHSLCIASTASVIGPLCRPSFIPRDSESVRPSLDLRGCRHPCVLLDASRTYIPNNFVLGGDEFNPRAMILTGSNMSGKSTAARSVALNVIMAQMGCYVPADSFTLTPVDRVFTRIGAQDRIMSGQSTFMVEMNETSTILREATENSLVLLDELGRGTSTHDGYCIAFAAFKDVIERIRCRAMMSTHYHMLCDDFSGTQGVASYHMAVDLSDSERIRFLYQLRPGPSEKSFGVDVAKSAGIPASILSEAYVISSVFEKESAITKFHVKKKQAKPSLQRLQAAMQVLSLLDSVSEEIASDSDAPLSAHAQAQLRAAKLKAFEG